MNDIYKGLITLIRSAITKECLPLPEAFSLQDAYPLIKAHQIANIVYEGAVNCGISKDEPLMQELFRVSYQCLLHSTKQMAAIQKLCDAFDAEGIKYMPMKGCNMKKLYPKPELRIMGDADILIRMEQYDKIVPILKQQGYHLLKESNHELIWDNEDLHLELHKRIVADHHEIATNYYTDGWHLAKKQSQYRYAMLPEDELVYLFSHFTIHYREGGIGCRQLVDVWVYLRQHPQLNQTYLRQQLDALQLLAFYDNVCHTIDVWFEDKQSDQMSDYISKVILSNGSWGTVQQHVIAKLSKNTEKGKVKERQRKKLWWTLFPRLPRMIQIYPFLQKLPWLMPVMWVVRWFQLLFGKRRHEVANWVKSNRNIAEEDVASYQCALSYVGLSYKH